MSPLLLMVGVLVFILGLPFLAAAVALVLLGLRAVAMAISALIFPPPRAPQHPLP